MRRFRTVGELSAAVGDELGHGSWHVVDQEQIDRFALATGDDQWIHTDPERASMGPFGATIAQGYLLLSLLPLLMAEVVAVERRSMGINYGLNRVRFTSPVRAGARVRASLAVADAMAIAGGAQIAYAVTLDVEGAAKPACVAEIVARIYA